jgi:negative regulator of sigma E activity
MNERLSAYLDGEMAAAALTAEERARAEAFEVSVAALREALDAEAPRDMDARVMSRIAQLEAEPERTWHPSRALRGLQSLLTPREIRLSLRPVYALGAAVALAALLVASPWSGGSSAPALGPSAAALPPAQQVYVQFRLQADAANTVELAGSFTDWQPVHPLQQTAEGVWTVVLAIPPGVHDYVFVVDGERWIPDPLAPGVDDGFGGTNSRMTLLSPATL